MLKHFHQKCNTNVLFVMVFTNTAHPYLHLCRTVLNSGEHHIPGDWSVSRLQAHPG